MAGVGRDKFIEKAIAVHGDKYDYSLVDYRTCKDKVKIICPVHGVFEQTPDHHVNGACGCPGCVAEKRRATVRARYGVDYVSQSNGFQERVERTNMLKYGVRRPMQSVDIRLKSIATSREHWGTDYPMQSAEVKAKFQHAFFEKYGVIVPFSADWVRDRAHASILDRYGVDNAMQNEFIRKKAFETRIRNGNSSSSCPEENLCSLLKACFGDENVIPQYTSDVYPFPCDAYVVSLDLYIELNAHWTHGQHWFNCNSSDDLRMVDLWKHKADAGSSYYKNAVHTWTVSDVCKKETAERNGLNYLVFWSNDLIDFVEWLDSIVV